MIGVASYFAYLNYHYVLTGSMFISGIGITILAITKKDKKDKQIEEIHATITNKTTNKLEPTIPKKQTKTQKQLLSETNDNILELLFKKSSTVENICKNLKLSREEANYYLTYLYENKEMINPPGPYSIGPELWSIDQKGREYIMAKREQV
ncbi:MAG: hypothetical protein PHH28_08660 [Desulfuromonadaceae bacterium]|nr:hypothetical protein [Desulfuromonadaceae bacterium]